MDRHNNKKQDDQEEKELSGSDDEQGLSSDEQSSSEEEQTFGDVLEEPVDSSLPLSASAVAASTNTPAARRRARGQRMHGNRHLVHERINKRNRRQRTVLSRLLTTMAIVFAVLFIVFSGAFGASYIYYQSQLPLLNNIANHTTFQTTRIYDRNGQLLYRINDPHHGRRTYFNYNYISQNLVNATIAAEDHTFWTNSG